MEKIGFYCSSISWGGLEMNIIKHAIWMQEKNWQIKIYAVKESPLYNSALENKLPVTIVNRNKKYIDLINAFKLSVMFRQDMIDILWIRDNRDISTCGISKLFGKCTYKLIYQQAMQLGVSKKDLFHTIRFNRIDAWISTLPSMAQQVKEMTNMNPSKIHVIPLGVDSSRFSNQKISKGEALKRFGITNDQPTIGIIGRLDPQKGQAFLIRALKKIQVSNLKPNLLIVGESTLHEGIDYQKELFKLTEELDLQNQVFFHPFIKDVEIFYQAIDIFAMASLAETFGTVTIEAMLTGKAVIGTNTGGTPELLGNGVLGLLYTPNNEDEFVSGISILLNTPNKIDQLGKQAQTEAIANYDYKHICNSIGELIHKLEG